MMLSSNNSMFRRKTNCFGSPIHLWEFRVLMGFPFICPTSHQLTAHCPLKLNEALEDELGMAYPMDDAYLE